MMFGYISKRKLKAYMDEIKKNNRAECNGANYDLPISDAQRTKNVYAQGYEDGTDNFFNAVCHKFKIEREVHEPMKTYIFSFVAEVRGEKIIKDIRERVSVCEDLMGVKERHAMALEIEFGRPFVCAEIREVTE